MNSDFVTTVNKQNTLLYHLKVGWEMWKSWLECQ